MRIKGSQLASRCAAGVNSLLIAVCGPVFLVDSLDAMRGVSRDLRGMMRSFRPTTRQYFTKLMFPAILPNLITSWKINLSLAIRVVTIAELVEKNAD